MKNLLTALLIIATVYACSSPTDFEFEPYRIGSFLITNPDNAEWIGNKNKQAIFLSSNDTLIVKNPLDFGLSLKLMEENLIHATYTDSNSIGFPNITNIEINVVPEQGELRFYNSSKNIGSDIIIISRGLDYRCGSNIESVNNVHVNYFGNDTLRKTIILKSSGFIDVVKELKGC